MMPAICVPRSRPPSRQSDFAATVLVVVPQETRVCRSTPSDHGYKASGTDFEPRCEFRNGKWAGLAPTICLECA